MSNYPNVVHHVNTQTKWARVWLLWYLLQPAPSDLSVADPSSDNRTYSSIDADPARKYQVWFYPGTVADYVARLDHEIRVAKFFGLKVILTFTGFPTWTNGTASTSAPSKTRVPTDVSSSSPWANALLWILRKWARSGQSLLDGVEIMNEPNLQWTPQQDQNGASTVAACYAAQMMQSAINTLARDWFATTLFAPAASDHIGANTPSVTNWSTFVGSAGGSSPSGLLGVLDSMNFTPFQVMAWSQHNYNDVLNDIGVNSFRSQYNFDGATFTAQARSRLRNWGRWYGFPDGNTDNPRVWITEGGVTLDNVAQAYPGVNILDRQAELLARNWYRSTGRAGWGVNDARGVEMLANYQWNTSAYDSGLLNAPPGFPPPASSPADGQPRPSYYAWAAEVPSI